MSMIIMIYLGIILILAMTYLISLKPSRLKRHLAFLRRIVNPFKTKKTVTKSL